MFSIFFWFMVVIFGILLRCGVSVLFFLRIWILLVCFVIMRLLFGKNVIFYGCISFLVNVVFLRWIWLEFWCECVGRDVLVSVVFVINSKCLNVCVILFEFVVIKCCWFYVMLFCLGLFIEVCRSVVYYFGSIVWSIYVVFLCICMWLLISVVDDLLLVFWVNFRELWYVFIICLWLWVSSLIILDVFGMFLILLIEFSLVNDL